MCQALIVANNILDTIAGRAPTTMAPPKGGEPKDAAKKKSIKKEAPKKPSTKKSIAKEAPATPSVAIEEPISMVWPIERREVPLDEAVHPAIARDHQILCYRLELIGIERIFIVFSLFNISYSGIKIRYLILSIMF